MNVVERGTCLRVCVSVITKMSKRTSTERVARSYWDWLPPELQQWILRLVRLDAANQLQQLVANPATLRHLKERFDLQFREFRPSWSDVAFMQRIFTRGPLLRCFRNAHAPPHIDSERRIVNHFFTIDGFEDGFGQSLTEIKDIHKGFRNVDALVCCTITRIYCAYNAWVYVNNDIAEEDVWLPGWNSYCCDTFHELRCLVRTAFLRRPRNKGQLRQAESISCRSL